MEEIRRVLPAEIPQIVSKVNEAFYKYPVFNYIFGTELSQQIFGAALFQFMIKSGIRFGKMLTYGKTRDNILIISENCEEPYKLPYQIAAGGLLIPFRCGFSVARRSLLFEKKVITLQRSSAPNNSMYVYLIGVRPLNQRKGIGTQLIEYCKKYALKHAKAIYLETIGEENVGYYKRRGFKVAGVIPFPERNSSLHGMVWQNEKDNSV